MISPLISVLLLAVLVRKPAEALNNGLAKTPPCGLNSYMSGKGGEVFLTSIADFFVSTGMDKSCFVFVNTDEGWEISQRNKTDNRLMWDPNQYPSGIPAFTASLAKKGVGMKFGLYGAASGVTCGVISGQLGYEDLDVQTFMDWGVAYLKSDNCASYAMDSSVRFAATRDALLRAQANIVYSIEPFSISPDVRQSSKVSNLWRVAMDIGGSYGDAINRANIADKWAPLAGPGGWNDPDMIHLGTQLSTAENRLHFGLWCIMKSPLLLSSDLPNLPAAIQAIITNPEPVAINQDPLGIQARKLLIDGKPLPWLVGLERCDLGNGGGVGGMFARGWLPQSDTRVWSKSAHLTVKNAFLLTNRATGRCLQPGTAMGLDTVVLLPCNATDANQAWQYAPNPATVANIVHNLTGMALTVGDSTLYSKTFGNDPLPVTDSAYGTVALGLGPFKPTEPCTSRDCNGYFPDQLWFGPDLIDGFIAQSTFVASINHCFDGSCYELTGRQPTFAHQCLAHVLSIRNMGTDAGTLEVWGGPLSNGSFVMALLNNGASSAVINAPFAALEWPSVGPSSQFCVRDVWARANLGVFTGAFNATVQSHDLAIFKLTPGAGC